MSKVGRNDLCPCESGRKVKKCHRRFVGRERNLVDAYLELEDDFKIGQHRKQARKAMLGFKDLSIDKTGYL